LSQCHQALEELENVNIAITSKKPDCVIIGETEEYDSLSAGLYFK